MRILLLSDIHIPFRANYDLLNKIKFDTVDQIIGLGDYVEEDVIILLEHLRVFNGVFGNMDDYYIKRNLPEKKILKISNFKIGLIHGHQAGWGDPYKLIDFFENSIDIMFYGHSHIPDDKIIKNIRVINPGALCEGNYAIVEINEKNVKVDFYKI